MQFADIIFSRYADPYTAMDSMLQVRRFTPFVIEMMERRTEARQWEMWLHKVFSEQSFDAWRGVNLLKSYKQPTRQASDKKVAEILADTLSILDGFNPDEGVT